MTKVPQDRSLTRRGLLRGAGLLAVGGIGASACGSPVATGFAGTGSAASSLTYWTPFTGGDGERMVAMQRTYRKANPTVNLKAVALTWGAPYYTKLSLAAIGDRPPDVAITHLDRHTTLVRAGLLEPLDLDLLAKHGISEDKFTPAAWRQAHVDGKLYAIPLDTHPWVLYYHKQVCKKAGLLDRDGRLKNLDGPDGLTDAMASAKKVTGKYGGVEAVIADPATAWREFATLYWQQGGRDLVAGNGTRVTLDESVATRTLQYQAALTVGKKLMPNIDYPGAVTAFSTGQAGFFLQGPWEVATFADAKTPFGMTTYPNVFGKNVVFASSHAFVMPKSASRDRDKRDLTLRFLRYMLDHSLTWAQGGNVPAWLPVQKSASFRKLEPQSDYVGAAYNVKYDPPAWYSGAGSNFENSIGSIVIGVKSGRVDPKRGAAAMRRRLAEFADIPPPTS